MVHPLLPRLEPRAAACHFLTGETFDAAEAARLGLLTSAAPDPDAALAPMLDGVRRAAPQARRVTKELVNAPVLAALDRDDGAMAALSQRLFAAPEGRERMTAFLERRDAARVR